MPELTPDAMLAALEAVFPDHPERIPRVRVYPVADDWFIEVGNDLASEKLYFEASSYGKGASRDQVIRAAYHALIEPDVATTGDDYE